ncbi:hypothetical protein KSP39_PZI014446 [Platanthera zijinensis]|uniref:Splicing factor 3B subunit 1 n=1 Tax=Platanthera zijinensis TaxID=2320716 RepID=A0AAP0BB93_9ASPA
MEVNRANTDNEMKKSLDERRNTESIALLSSVAFNSDLYEETRFEGYVHSIPVNEEEGEDDGDAALLFRRRMSYTDTKSLIDIPGADGEDDSGFKKPSRIMDREDECRRRLDRIISPTGNNPFTSVETTPDASVRTYADVMREQALQCQKEELLKAVAKKHEEEKSNKTAVAAAEAPLATADASQKRRNMCDESQYSDSTSATKKTKSSSDWDAPDSTPGIGRWDATPTPRIGALLNDDEEEQQERKIKRLLLKVMNGTLLQRETALRQLTDKAREFGAGPLFNQILPLLMLPTLGDQERHLLVNVIDRVLYKLGELVRPFVHIILVVTEPLLIDEDYYARFEGRRIISHLSKAAGLATMIAAMRPNIDNIDVYVRNTTARAFSAVASAFGIPALLPFLKAVCQSKKSWQARHTGIKIVQQIAFLMMGCAVLAHLRSLVEIIEHGLSDENQKVRTITALSLAALAEAAAPYGIESFDSVLKPLWKGICWHRGKALAAFLTAFGFIIPLMDAQHASYYTKEVMVILIREFQSPSDEMKRIVLKVVKQCVRAEGVEADYIRNDILPEFFRIFWVRHMALDKRNYTQLVDTTVEIANKVGVTHIVARIAKCFYDDRELHLGMVMETIGKVISNLGAPDFDARVIDILGGCGTD